LQALLEFPGLSLLFGVIDAPVTHDFTIGEDVFRDGEIAKQIQFLEDRADAMSYRIARAPEVDRRPIGRFEEPRCVGCRQRRRELLETEACRRQGQDCSTWLHRLGLCHGWRFT
jgi:hypothetical protein